MTSCRSPMQMSRSPIVVVVLLLLCVLGSACRPAPKPPADKLEPGPAFVIPVWQHGLPQEVLVHHHTPQDTVWHVCRQTETRLFMVYTHSGEYGATTTERQYHLQVMHLDAQQAYSWVSGGPATKPFRAEAGREVLRPPASGSGTGAGSGGSFVIHVSGMAADSRTARITAETSKGRIFETEPCNGFWYLEATTDGDEAWIAARAVDRNENTVHDFSPVAERQPVSPLPKMTILDGSGEFELSEPWVCVGS